MSSVITETRWALALAKKWQFCLKIVQRLHLQSSRRSRFVQETSRGPFLKTLEREITNTRNSFQKKLDRWLIRTNILEMIRDYSKIIPWFFSKKRGCRWYSGVDASTVSSPLPSVIDKLFCSWRCGIALLDIEGCVSDSSSFRAVIFKKLSHSTPYFRLPNHDVKQKRYVTHVTTKRKVDQFYQIHIPTFQI